MVVAPGAGEAALAQGAQGLHRLPMLALDASPIAQERAQRPEGAVGGRSLGVVGDLAGGEQVREHLRFQLVVGTDLAPTWRGSPLVH